VTGRPAGCGVVGELEATEKSLIEATACADAQVCVAHPGEVTVAEFPNDPPAFGVMITLTVATPPAPATAPTVHVKMPLFPDPQVPLLAVPVTAETLAAGYVSVNVILCKASPLLVIV